MLGREPRVRISADAGDKSRVGVKPETIKILYDEIVRGYKNYNFDVSIQRDGTRADPKPKKGRGIVTFADKDRIAIDYGKGNTIELGGLRNEPLTRLEIHSKTRRGTEEVDGEF